MVKFSKGGTQKDSFIVHVLPQAPSPKPGGKIAIFDPGGETGRLLNAREIRCSPVEANADLSAYDILIVGKNALTVGGPAPDITRAWRCGNRGNVASVLIEKPVIGDFLPIVDGGFSLQYSPLMEYREGKGMVLFCQLDVTGLTETDPAAEMLVRNILEYACNWGQSNINAFQEKNSVTDFKSVPLGKSDNGDRFKPVPIIRETLAEWSVPRYSRRMG